MRGVVPRVSQVLARFCQGAMRCDFAHKFDGRGWLAQMSGLLSSLQRLFRFRNEDGQLQKPLVLDKGYKTGYVQAFRRTWNLLDEQPLTADGKMCSTLFPLCFERRHSSMDHNKVGRHIWNAVDVYLKGLFAEHDFLLASGM